MPLDTNLLLSAERLYLEPGLLRGRPVRGVFTLKRVSSQTYLVVNELQSHVLEEFAQPRNVPDALESCIRRRTCPPLREFYDLILKAHRAGVLRSEELEAAGPPPRPRPPVQWAVPLPPKAGLMLAGISLIAVLVALGLRVPVLSLHGLDLLYGWLAVCGALSLGHLLAASALHGAGCEVHRPHLCWRSFAPHFAVELDDGCMTDRVGRAAPLALILLPLAVTTTVALWFGQAWVLPPLVAFVVGVCPVGTTVVGRLLPLLRRRPWLTTDGAPLFDAQLSLFEQWRVAWERFDGRVAAVQGGLGVLWGLAVGFIAFRASGILPWLELPQLSTWWLDLGAVVGAVVLVVAFALATEVQHRLIDATVALWRRVGAELRRWRVSRRPDPAPFELDALVRRHPLLRQLDPDAQEELVAHLVPLRERPWRRIIGFDEEASFVGLVVSGRATVYQRLKSGRKLRFFGIREGDLFGAHPLVDPAGSSVEVKTGTPLLAVTLGREDFLRIVVGKLGVPAVCRYVQSHLFLHRAAALCADWRPTAITRFAELASTATHAPGGKIILQGQEVGSLHVLYEGRARALKNRKPVGRLSPGDFFGEISLLQTSAATADVETIEETRCLVVNRIEFIRFLSRNQHVALQLERLCTKRLGHPIFQLDRPVVVA
ncbi:MAG: cyclic nucleotide-binding domain-containing protein, partial [Verrucomicrobia bacterium]|nr:cyclic nucleotide-binding domain-containing protein [Verrucomicrobiota bacterium]